MKKTKLFIKILKVMGTIKIILGLIVSIFIFSFALQAIEPQINTYGDALWYCFSVISTIGFGDFSTITLIGRIITIFLGVYGIIVVALLTGTLVNFYSEFAKIKANESVTKFLEELEDLENLSKDELAQLSKKVRERDYKL